MTWGKGRGEPEGGAPTSWREGLHAVIADVWNICKGQEKAPKSYTSCHTPPPLASSPKLCSGLDSAPQMPRLILYPTLTAGSCKLLLTKAFSPLKSSTDVRICLLLGFFEVRGCGGLGLFFFLI